MKRRTGLHRIVPPVRHRAEVLRIVWECEEPVKRHKQEILEQLREIATDYLSRMDGTAENSALPDACYRAIGNLGWPMDESACQKVLLELQSDGE